MPCRVEKYPTARSLAAQRGPRLEHEYRIAPGSPSACRVSRSCRLTTRAEQGARSATPPASPPPTPAAAPLLRVPANRHATPASPTAPGWQARRSTATFMMPPTNSKRHQHPAAADAVGAVQQAHAQRARRAGPPMPGQELGGGPAAPEAHVLQGRELVEARSDQDGGGDTARSWNPSSSQTARPIARAAHCRRPRRSARSRAIPAR